VRRLIPAAGLEDVELGDAELAAAYAYPPLPSDGHWLRANMISSVDGAAVDADGGSRALSGSADRRVLATLRRLADVIVVGSGTVRADPGAYRPVRPSPEVREHRIAAGRAAAPRIAIVTASLDLDLGAEPFQDGRPLLVTIPSAPADRLVRAREVADVVLAGDGPRPDPAAMVRELVARGLPRILCEGGPRLLAAIAGAGLLDELCLTVSPQLAGPGDRTRILAGRPGGVGTGRLRGAGTGQPGAARAPAQPLELAHLLEADGYLFARYLPAAGPR